MVVTGSTDAQTLESEESVDPADSARVSSAPSRREEPLHRCVPDSVIFSQSRSVLDSVRRVQKAVHVF